MQSAPAEVKIASKMATDDCRPLMFNLQRFQDKEGPEGHPGVICSMCTCLNGCGSGSEIVGQIWLISLLNLF